MATVCTMSGRWRLTLAASSVLAAVVVTTAAAPAWAHKGPSIAVPVPMVAPATPMPARTESFSLSASPSLSFKVAAAPVASSFGWLALLACAAALTTVFRRFRSAPVISLALLLAVFAYERGVHSVHHLGQPVQEHECAVAAAATHTESAADDVSNLLPPVLAPVYTVGEVSRLPLGIFDLSAEHERAPPAPRLRAIFS